MSTCCPTDKSSNSAIGPPLAPRGEVVSCTKAGDETLTSPIDIYITRPVDNVKPKGVIVAVHDIFGMHDSTKYVCDCISASTQCVLVMPDFYRGKPWDASNFPPKEGWEVLQKWIGEVSAWKPFRKDVIAAIEAVDPTRTLPLAMLGFCWGGRMLFQSMQDASLSIKCGATAHPAMLTVEAAEKMVGSVYIILSKDDPPFLEVNEALQNREGTASLRFETVDGAHGFMSARADWASVDNVKLVNESVEKFSKFFIDELHV